MSKLLKIAFAVFVGVVHQVSATDCRARRNRDEEKFFGLAAEMRLIDTVLSGKGSVDDGGLQFNAGEDELLHPLFIALKARNVLQAQLQLADLDKLIAYGVSSELFKLCLNACRNAIMILDTKADDITVLLLHQAQRNDSLWARICLDLKCSKYPIISSQRIESINFFNRFVSWMIRNRKECMVLKAEKKSLCFLLAARDAASAESFSKWKKGEIAAGVLVAASIASGCIVS